MAVGAAISAAERAAQSVDASPGASGSMASPIGRVSGGKMATLLHNNSLATR